MSSIVFFILSLYILKHRKLWHPVIIGIIAASFKVFNIFILGVSLFSRGIVNPAINIIMESTIVSVAAFGLYLLAKLPIVVKIKYKLLVK